MSPIRGFVRARYYSDDGNVYALQVDADSAEDASRGWDLTDAATFPLAPRGLLPRRVLGIDETGRQQEARVAHTEAALWTGEVTTFTVEASDGTVATATVVLRQAERQLGQTGLGL